MTAAASKSEAKFLNNKRMSHLFTTNNTLGCGSNPVDFHLQVRFSFVAALLAFDLDAIILRRGRSLIYFGACIVAGLRRARERQVNVRVVPTGHAGLVLTAGFSISSWLPAGFLRFCFCHSASRRAISSFETVNILRVASSWRLASVLPGTGGAGRSLDSLISYS
jgi:hypothetical protein